MFVLLGVAASDDDEGDMFGFIQATEPFQDQKSVPRNTTAMADIGRKADIEND